ncbi:MAG: hypothetical protein FWF80_01830 [Defluviitaleaceae bacterium]|nr:hypothetical protein [Defluviitaleaceae bacterium]
MNEHDEMNVVNEREPAKSPLPLISMILGIASVVTGCCGMGMPLGVGAIVLAVLCKKQGVTNDAGYVTAGLITGIVGSVLQIILVILYFVLQIGYILFV